MALKEGFIAPKSINNGLKNGIKTPKTGVKRPKNKKI